jgi:lysophospholipase L1-like esterase
MIRRSWLFLGIVLLSAISTISVARLSFTNEGIVFRKACSILDRVRSGVAYADCRRELFANATQRNAPQASIIALGDSFTERQDWGRQFPNLDIMNRGIGGVALKEVAEVAKLVSPNSGQTVLVLVGLNDLLGLKRTVSDIIKDYRELVQMIGDNGSRIVVQSVIMCNQQEPRCNDDFRKDISALNNGLHQLAVEKAIKFIDLNQTLAPDGPLSTTYSDADGHHLNAAGNLAWAKLLESTLLGALVRKPS